MDCFLKSLDPSLSNWLLTRTITNVWPYSTRKAHIDPVLSDHYAVCCKVLLSKPPLQKKETAYRSLKCIDFARFREDIKNLDLLDNDIASIADLVEAHNAKLASLLDDHAPVRNKVVTLRPKSPWFTPEIREQKLKRRRLERRWRKLD